MLPPGPNSIMLCRKNHRENTIKGVYLCLFLCVCMRVCGWVGRWERRVIQALQALTDHFVDRRLDLATTATLLHFFPCSQVSQRCHDVHLRSYLHHYTGGERKLTPDEVNRKSLQWSAWSRQLRPVKSIPLLHHRSALKAQDNLNFYLTNGKF